MRTCFHCGDDCGNSVIFYLDKTFCCNGCKTVFDILNENNLSYYYELENTPGLSPIQQDGKFDFLDNADVVAKLLEFDSQGIQVVTLLIPSIHCSSCIWVLENLNKLHSAVKTTQVNFPEKTVRICFSSDKATLKDITTLLSRIGYEPYICLENTIPNNKAISRSLIYKLGVAGFAFGNIMFLSFPEYFEVNEYWLEKFKPVFHWLMFAFSVPVVFYSASDYFLSAYKGLRSNFLNIDLPIAIGVSVLFLRSSFEVVMNLGTGFFDSLTGLIFFLLLGKFFQQKTYAFLSFERDYKSYFPIAVTQLLDSKIPQEQQTQVEDLKKGDRILIRHNELLPVDAILLKGEALIDYSFVTGEAEPVEVFVDETLFAGGRQQAGSIEVEVVKPLAQSYLTQLWTNVIFKKDNISTFQSLTDSISKRFTISLLIIALLASCIWVFIDASKALNIFTAVLIVACPCAIALAAPFTLGNILRIFGLHQLYMKDSNAIEKLAHIDTIVFDKTGTLTTAKKNTIIYKGINLTKDEKTLLTSTIRASNHPLSRALYSILKTNTIEPLDCFNETVGQGISASVGSHNIKIGSYGYVNSGPSKHFGAFNKTLVHINVDNNYKGFYVFCNDYRDGMETVFNRLKANYKIAILSGDNDGEKRYLSRVLPEDTVLLFNQKPGDKLNYIKLLQKKGANVLMIGDGLNDAGALAQANIGITISENVNVFSPACDAILEASRFNSLPSYLKISKQAIKLIKYAFIFSLFYNCIGLLFAVTGHLKPVVAAILMPLSSISIVVFTTIGAYILGKELNT